MTKLKKLAIEEATMLKTLLTKAEKKRLLNGIDYLNADNPFRCIYGLATKDCRSKRALDLIMKSCKKVYNVIDDYNIMSKAKLNGAPTKVIPSQRLYRYVSPIEKAIYLKGGHAFGKKLINFICDVTKTI